MAFNNASLGYVDAMAHQLGGFYDLPHGVCNVVLLPHVQKYNALVTPVRLKDIAKAMGGNVEGLLDEEGANKAIEAIKTLSENALKDACGLKNPKQATLEEIIEIYTEAM